MAAITSNIAVIDCRINNITVVKLVVVLVLRPDLRPLFNGLLSKSRGFYLSQSITYSPAYILFCIVSISDKITVKLRSRAALKQRVGQIIM